MELVIKKDEKVITTSRIVAEVFGKRHDDVLKRLRNLGCSEEFTARHFAESEYLNSQGKLQPEYEMTKAGWSFLVMGFTGKKAVAFKESYINAFENMESKLGAYMPQVSPGLLTRDLLSVALELGYSKSTATVKVLSLVDNKYPEHGVLGFLGENVATEQERLLTVSQISNIINEGGGLSSPQTINKLLAEMGYQYRNEKKEWILTTAGKEHGVYLDLKRRGTDGTIRCVRWKSDLIDHLTL
jgi:Rha family phage regulatory protein